MCYLIAIAERFEDFEREEKSKVIKWKKHLLVVDVVEFGT